MPVTYAKYENWKLLNCTLQGIEFPKICSPALYFMGQSNWKQKKQKNNKCCLQCS